MQLYGLLGYPLGHSFSAKYFAEKFEKERIDAEYHNFEYADVDEAMHYLMNQPQLVGFNVTIPHKQHVIPYLDRLTPEAEAIGAVNVVCVKVDEQGNRCLIGANSDVIGFTQSVRPLLSPTIHTHALVLGTGGASKAVMYGLKSLGISPIYVSRTPGDGRMTYADLTPDVMAQYKLIVNCSPVGMFPHVDQSPLLPYECLTSEHVLYDLVYNPLETLFMKKGREQGSIVKNGLEMLHLQAEAAWEIWHNANL